MCQHRAPCLQQGRAEQEAQADGQCCWVNNISDSAYFTAFLNGRNKMLTSATEN